MRHIVPGLLWLPKSTYELSASLLRQCKGLNSLSLYPYVAIESKDLQQFSNLRSLSLFTPHIHTDAIASLPMLTRLEVSFSATLYNADFAQLTRLESLHIQLDDWKGVPVSDMLKIKPTSLFEVLEFIENEALTDETLSSLTRLRSLSLSVNTRLTGQSFSTLSLLTQLKLYKCAGVKTRNLATLTQLKSLCLHDYKRMPGYDLKHLSSLTCLEHVCIATEREAEIAPIARTQWPEAQIEYIDWLFGI